MSLVAANQKLFDTKEDADVTFIIDKQELQAHQLILSNRSPVLKAMIKGPMAPSNQRHEINDPEISFEDFENFVKFLYTDQCKIKPENVEALLHLSNMYDIPFLFQTCVTKLPQFFSATTIYKYAELGLLYENRFNLLTKCFKKVPIFASTSSLQYLQENKMIWISAELALEFVKYCSQCGTFTEDKVFQKVFEWAKGRCETQELEINAVNVKKFMAPFETYIKYESLEMNTLATTVYEYEMISAKRHLKQFRDNYLATKESSKVLQPPPKKARASAFYVDPFPQYYNDDDDWFDDEVDIDFLFESSLE